MNDKYYTAKEAASILNVHWQTIRNYIDQNKIQTIKIGRSIRIPESEINKYFDREEKPDEETVEVEHRYILKNRIRTENKLRKMGAKLTGHSHITDHYFAPNSVKSMKDKDDWYDSPTGYAVRIRELDNDYSGRIITTMEVGKLAGPDYTDHSNTIEKDIVVPDYRSTKELLILMDSKEFLTIDKERFVYSLNNIKYCFDSIKDWKDGLEIEIVSPKSEIGKAQGKIKKAATALGLKEKHKANRSFTYMIMQERAQF